MLSRWYCCDKSFVMLLSWQSATELRLKYSHTLWMRNRPVNSCTLCKSSVSIWGSQLHQWVTPPLLYIFNFLAKTQPSLFKKKQKKFKSLKVKNSSVNKDNLAYPWFTLTCRCVHHGLCFCVRAAGDRAEGAEATLEASLNKLTLTVAQKERDSGDEQDPQYTDPDISSPSSASTILLLNRVQ